MFFPLDPTACTIDAFNMNMDCIILYYSFPPFSCIGRLLQKMLIDRAEMILVAPLWNTQHWFTKILKLLQQILSFFLQHNKFCPFQWSRKLKLCECRLSGNFSNNVEYHKNNPKSSFHQGDNLPHSSFRCTCI